MPIPKDPTPKLSAMTQAEPDLVDRIFDYILAELPQIADCVQKHKDAVRAEFMGQKCWVAARPPSVRQETVTQVLALFNGRNATEVARRLQISRATVYRLLKQPGQNKPSQNFWK